MYNNTSLQTILRLKTETDNELKILYNKYLDKKLSNEERGSMLDLMILAEDLDKEIKKRII